ncbi:hypothetical protein HPB49_009034 [Dermacentor silvarum]|uniref:Uncharacterized protein n=1 Tax=Dermacentor silvarum TaxID=543639 RepID=A0ACB8CKB7_DERSI|nr:hypothetical protein HPB49_009034 [Dermacentor silvarum]
MIAKLVQSSQTLLLRVQLLENELAKRCDVHYGNAARPEAMSSEMLEDNQQSRADEQDGIPAHLRALAASNFGTSAPSRREMAGAVAWPTSGRAGPYCAFVDKRSPPALKKSLFATPRETDRLKIWRHAIPRKDRVLQSTDYVCEKHFEPRYVTKTSEAVYKEHLLVSAPRKAALAKDAVPTSFPTALLT